MTGLTQAQQLTRWVTRKGGSVRVLAITSGKGGVGKTSVTVNLAARLARRGHRTLVLDADLGLGNVDVMVGLTPTRSLAEVIAGQCPLERVIVPGPEGIQVIPAGSGLAHLTHLGEEGQLALLGHVAALDPPPDYLILDTGAGIGANVRFFSGCAQEILVVTTPDPTAITDAYALMKVMVHHHGERRFRLVVNRAADRPEALDVYRRLSLAADRFLGAAVDLAGFVPDDTAMSAAIRGQRGVSTAPPLESAYNDLAGTVEGWRAGFEPRGRMQFFVNRTLTSPDTAPVGAGG